MKGVRILRFCWKCEPELASLFLSGLCAQAAAADIFRPFLLEGEENGSDPHNGHGSSLGLRLKDGRDYPLRGLQRLEDDDVPWARLDKARKFLDEAQKRCAVDFLDPRTYIVYRGPLCEKKKEEGIDALLFLAEPNAESLSAVFGTLSLLPSGVPICLVLAGLQRVEQGAAFYLEASRELDDFHPGADEFRYCGIFSPDQDIWNVVRRSGRPWSELFPGDALSGQLKYAARRISEAVDAGGSPEDLRKLNGFQ
jgi:hypothetical protein